MDSMRAKGMRDMLPADMARFRRVEAAFRDVCLGWGYEEVRTPTIEHLYLFTQAGTLSPQMLDRVYSFLDYDGWTGERVVLRPDSTIPAVRLFAERMTDRDGARLFYVQNVLRFDAGDADREEYQCGVELLGDTYPGGDVELILMARETLARLGLGTRLKLSHPGIVRSLLDKAGLDVTEQLALYDRVLAGDLSGLDDVEAKLPGSASIRALLAKDGQGPAFLQNLETVLTPAVPEVAGPLRELAAVSTTLDGMGITHEISPLLVRNFEYYTGPVFHIFSGDHWVGGGGRYDQLAALVGGRSVPASGFALEMDEVAALLSEPASGSAAVTIRCVDAADLGQAFALATALREANAAVTVGKGPSPDTAREVVVSGGSFALSLNGGKPKKLSDIAEVVRAVTGA
jgi:histidyl-tRNA synthetase